VLNIVAYCRGLTLLTSPSCQQLVIDCTSSSRSHVPSCVVLHSTSRSIEVVVAIEKNVGAIYSSITAICYWGTVNTVCQTTSTTIMPSKSVMFSCRSNCQRYSQSYIVWTYSPCSSDILYHSHISVWREVAFRSKARKMKLLQLPVNRQNQMFHVLQLPVIKLWTSKLLQTLSLVYRLWMPHQRGYQSTKLWERW